MDEVCRVSYSFTLPQSTSTLPLQESASQGFPRAGAGQVSHGGTGKHFRSYHEIWIILILWVFFY